MQIPTNINAYTYKRGLSRVEAASYIGIGVTTFDDLVKSGSMPSPKCIKSRKVWDKLMLDIAFDDLPNDKANIMTEYPNSDWE